MLLKATRINSRDSKVSGYVLKDVLENPLRTQPTHGRGVIIAASTTPTALRVDKPIRRYITNSGTSNSNCSSGYIRAVGEGESVNVLGAIAAASVHLATAPVSTPPPAQAPAQVPVSGHGLEQGQGQRGQGEKRKRSSNHAPKGPNKKHKKGRK
ncbi:hypothetical protein BCR34DRAFT_613876 [Clohesyomyces aquaticus]|uniref:Uncharacterized protein n=1 Tax=Clohesyomyces aquaticus TaxID=1231657 RepID=A0A1Y1ZQT8_9PLEO|nr:hypothetical protein BCR34DRAFT_613876 [Clohesyomyces aquaticus]